MAERSGASGDVAIVAATDDEVIELWRELRESDFGCHVFANEQVFLNTLGEWREQGSVPALAAVIIPGISDPRDRTAEDRQRDLIHGIEVGLHASRLENTGIVIMSRHWWGQEIKPRWSKSAIIRPWQELVSVASVVGSLLLKAH